MIKPAKVPFLGANSTRLKVLKVYGVAYLVLAIASAIIAGDKHEENSHGSAATSEKVFAITPEEFRNTFNAQMSGIGDGSFKLGEFKSSGDGLFAQALNDEGTGIQLTVSKKSGKINTITVASSNLSSTTGRLRLMAYVGIAAKIVNPDDSGAIAVNMVFKEAMDKPGENIQKTVGNVDYSALAGKEGVGFKLTPHAVETVGYTEGAVSQTKAIEQIRGRLLKCDGNVGDSSKGSSVMLDSDGMLFWTQQETQQDYGLYKDTLKIYKTELTNGSLRVLAGSSWGSEAELLERTTSHDTPEFLASLSPNQRRTISDTYNSIRKEEYRNKTRFQFDGKVYLVDSNFRNFQRNDLVGTVYKSFFEIIPVDRGVFQIKERWVSAERKYPEKVMVSNCRFANPVKDEPSQENEKPPEPSSDNASNAIVPAKTFDITPEEFKREFNAQMDNVDDGAFKLSEFKAINDSGANSFIAHSTNDSNIVIKVAVNEQSGKMNQITVVATGSSLMVGLKFITSVKHIAKIVNPSDSGEFALSLLDETAEKPEEIIRKTVGNVDYGAKYSKESAIAMFAAIPHE